MRLYVLYYSLPVTCSHIVIRASNCAGVSAKILSIISCLLVWLIVCYSFLYWLLLARSSLMPCILPAFQIVPNKNISSITSPEVLYSSAISFAISFAMYISLSPLYLLTLTASWAVTKLLNSNLFYSSYNSI